jgi:sec-independent protein translocase protein TatB
MFPEGRIVDFMLVAAVALIVVGPKDLPVLMRKVGQFVARMRGMAAEFRASFDEIARQSELDELRREVEAMRANVTLPQAAAAVVGPEAAGTLEAIHSGLKEVDSGLAQEVPVGSLPATESDDQPNLPFGEPAAKSHSEPAGETATSVRAEP